MAAVTRVISGGQSGVDIGALQAAELLGLSTGGWACRGWLTERGVEKELLEGFGLKECLREGYAARTEINVRDSDATVIISNERKLTGGSYMTECVAVSMERSVWRVCAIPDSNGGWRFENWLVSGSKIPFSAWLGLHNVRVLNVAGPRLSKWPGGEEAAAQWVCEMVGGLEES